MGNPKTTTIIPVKHGKIQTEPHGRLPKELTKPADVSVFTPEPEAVGKIVEQPKITTPALLNTEKEGFKLNKTKCKNIAWWTLAGIFGVAVVYRICKDWGILGNHEPAMPVETDEYTAEDSLVLNKKPIITKQDIEESIKYTSGNHKINIDSINKSLESQEIRSIDGFNINYDMSIANINDYIDNMGRQRLVDETKSKKEEENKKVKSEQKDEQKEQKVAENPMVVNGKKKKTEAVEKKTVEVKPAEKKPPETRTVSEKKVAEKKKAAEKKETVVSKQTAVNVYKNPKENKPAARKQNENTPVNFEIVKQGDCAWTMAERYLRKNPEVYKKIKAELASKLGYEPDKGMIISKLTNELEIRRKTKIKKENRDLVIQGDTIDFTQVIRKIA